MRESRQAMPQRDDPKAFGTRGIGIIRPHCAQGRGSAQEEEDSKIGRSKKINRVDWELNVQACNLEDYFCFAQNVTIT